MLTCQRIEGRQGLLHVARAGHVAQVVPVSAECDAAGGADARQRAHRIGRRACTAHTKGVSIAGRERGVDAWATGQRDREEEEGQGWREARLQHRA